MERHVLRPNPAHSAPIIVLAAVGTIAGLTLGVELLKVGNPGSAAFVAVAGLLCGLSTIAYFRNASIWFNDAEVGKVNLLGIETKCVRDQLRSVDTGFSPQPTLNFLRKDGSRAFRINRRLWTDDQVGIIRDAVSGLGNTQAVDPYGPHHSA